MNRVRAVSGVLVGFRVVARAMRYVVAVRDAASIIGVVQVCSGVRGVSIVFSCGMSADSAPWAMAEVRVIVFSFISCAFSCRLRSSSSFRSSVSTDIISSSVFPASVEFFCIAVDVACMAAFSLGFLVFCESCFSSFDGGVDWSASSFSISARCGLRVPVWFSVALLRDSSGLRPDFRSALSFERRDIASFNSRILSSSTFPRLLSG